MGKLSVGSLKKRLRLLFLLAGCIIYKSYIERDAFLFLRVPAINLVDLISLSTRHVDSIKSRRTRAPLFIPIVAPLFLQRARIPRTDDIPHRGMQREHVHKSSLQYHVSAARYAWCVSGRRNALRRGSPIDNKRNATRLHDTHNCTRIACITDNSATYVKYL